MFQKHQFKDSFIITPPLITNSKVKFVRPISNQSTRSLLTSSKKSKSLSKIRKGKNIKLKFNFIWYTYTKIQILLILL